MDNETPTSEPTNETPLSRKAIIIGSAAIGIIIAGGFAFMKKSKQDDESVFVENGDGDITVQ